VFVQITAAQTGILLCYCTLLKTPRSTATY